MAAHQKEVDFYFENGFCQIDDLFSPELRAELIDFSENLETFKDGSMIPVFQPHHEHDLFLRALKNPNVVAVMEKLLGGPVSGIQTQFFFGRPGTVGFNCHQDNYYVQASPDAFASAWMPLEDTDPENGGLIVYPKSHEEDLLPFEEVEVTNTFGQAPNAVRQELILPEKYEPMDVHAKAGSGVFIHGHVAHKSHSNTSKDRFRRVLLMTYVREGEPFREGREAKREAVNVYE